MQIRTINKKLAELGYTAQLFKGDGYFYFVDSDTEYWKQTSVYVYKLNDIDLNGWIEEFKILKADRI